MWRDRPCHRRRAGCGCLRPVAIDVVRVVEQPLDVQLSLPGELTAYQSVAIYPRVSGFVKTVSVDRGSRVRAGDVLATLEAPNLWRSGPRPSQSCRAQKHNSRPLAHEADADRSTFDRLKAASATPGVVAGNDVVIAEKAADASQSQVAAAAAER